MSMWRIGVPAALIIAVLAGLAGWARPAPAMFGFTREGARSEAVLEREFLALPSAESIASELQMFAGQPHVAGSRRDHDLMIRTRDHFAASGLEEIEVTTHEVLLPWPEEVVVEMVAPARWRATSREPAIPVDPYTAIPAEEAGIPFHAYSASGEVTAPALAVGEGHPSDYAALERRGINVRGRIVLARSSGPYTYRGFKVLAAEQRGAAGILIYSDPAEEHSDGGAAYPDGPWGPEGRIQRGAVAYDFLVPGDPLTPGWASTPGAPRLPKEKAVSLPRILSAPLSVGDARTILAAADPIVRLRVRLDDRIRPIWTVTGLIRGSEAPDDLVILGNHRDAWVYGAVDPSGGSAALMELAGAIGALKKRGWRPRRTILFASWDAEEFTLTGSTEWGEQHAPRLARHGVAYINVDSGASGARFTASAVPSLNRILGEAAQVVRDPAAGIPVAAASRDRRTRDRGSLQTGAARELVDNRLGGGTDAAVFLYHLGIPVANIGFTGPYGVYHSLYDTPLWLARIGDPGFRYHAALVQIWGVLTLRLANADALPLDYEASADQIAGFINQLQARQGFAAAGAPGFDILQMAGARLQRAAAEFARRRDAALAENDVAALARLNARLITVERGLVDAAGLHGRPWYRHLIYAPAFTYAPEVLPGITAALEANDQDRLAHETDRLAAALVRAARALE